MNRIAQARHWEEWDPSDTPPRTKMPYGPESPVPGAGFWGPDQNQNQNSSGKVGKE